MKNSEQEMIVSIMKSYGVTLSSGWFYSNNYKHFQKVNKNVYVYVKEELFGRWKVQMYRRGELGYCTLDAIIHNNINGEKLTREEHAENIQKLFDLGDIWLEKYKDSLDGVEEEPYYIAYKEGWKGGDITGVPIFY